MRFGRDFGELINIKYFAVLLAEVWQAVCLFGVIQLFGTYTT